MGEFVAKRVRDLRIVRQCRVHLRREPLEVWIPLFDAWLELWDVYRAVVTFETFTGEEVQHEIPLGPFAGGGVVSRFLVNWNLRAWARGLAAERAAEKKKKKVYGAWDYQADDL
ncbi:hypothetical protein SEA_ZOOMAN_285 [Microbacterium phage Zooman]|nr:hypothetical protein SEA_ZOOMAN_285 [Microbacterium phage Zooman]